MLTENQNLCPSTLNLSVQHTELFGYSFGKTPVKALAVLHILDDHTFLTEAGVCHEVYPIRADWKCIY